MTTKTRAAVVIAALLLPCAVRAAPAFGKHVHANLPYRLHVPTSDDHTQTYPLVLWLHGGAGRGRDNEKQIAEGNAAGATVWTTLPAFVVAPQCPEGQTWTAILPDVVALVKELQRTYTIDARRIYVAGQSLGGYGVWALIAEYPEMFAAAVPICGGGDVAKAARMKNVPVWAFHGELDRAVLVARSREMITAMRRAGGRPRYTEYRGADHVVWNRAFAEPALISWVFAQRRR